MDDPKRRQVYNSINAAAPRLLGSKIKTGPARGLRFNGGDTVGYILGLSEPAVQRALVEHLQPGDVYFDVGTHAGFLALLGARLVGPGGQVHCFEPVTENVEVLSANLTLNHFENATIHQLALGAVESEGRMTAGRNITASLGGDGELVRIVALDALELPAPKLIKIDVEGAETEVLNGAREAISTHRPVLVVEIHGEQEAPVRSVLAELGYRDPALISDGGMPHLIAYE